MARNKPHIFLKNYSRPISYTFPREVIPPPFKVPNRNRNEHGSKLLDQVNSINDESENLAASRESNGLTKQRGIIIEVESYPGFELKEDSLDKSGFQLLSLHEAKSEKGIIQLAIVFIADGKLNTFINKIKEYLEKEKIDTGKPLNKSLIESIESIRKATLKSLWTDDSDLFPATDSPVWWEVWLADREDLEEDVLSYFQRSAPNFRIRISDQRIRFPERYVILVNAKPSDLSASFELLNCISELRKPKTTANFFTSLSPIEQVDWVKNLKGRIQKKEGELPSVCILDSGVNRDNLLLKDFLNEKDVLTYFDDKDGTDFHSLGHGTAMAGIALYGDLVPLLESSDEILISHILESVQVFRKNNDHDPQLYGDIISQCVSKIEIINPSRNRVFNHCISSEEGLDRGKPSSWSAMLDQLSSGYWDEVKRLFLVSTGNVPTEYWHLLQNENFSIEDPGQSYNALTIGAYTDKTFIDIKETHEYSPLVEKGSLSPFSKTSVTWENDWAIKPELVMEGGNLAVDASGFVSELDSLSLLSCHHLPTKAQFTAVQMTSPATACVSGMAAEIQARYPEFWSETIRGLLIHTAEWTDKMKKEFSIGDKKYFLRKYGYGVPDFKRAIASAENSLHLIFQDEIQPFILEDGRIKTNHLKFYELPWPETVLTSLKEEDVEFRFTLSYFIEPDPARRGFKNSFQYQSHGLRFHLKRAGETETQFRDRINKEESSEIPSPEKTDAGWLLGANFRNKGSLHHDRWKGTAVDLASRNRIAIIPTGGWWKERKKAERYNRISRFSLILSIHTQKEDIYSEVASKLKLDTGVVMI